MCRNLDAARVYENRRHTRGYVEDFRESMMRKRSVQIESKIAQFRLKVKGENNQIMHHNSHWHELIKQDLLRAFFRRSDLINCPNLIKPITKSACMSIHGRKEFSMQTLAGHENYRPPQCKDCEHNDEKEDFPVSNIFKVEEN